MFSKTVRFCDRLSDKKIFGYSYSQSQAKIVNHNHHNRNILINLQDCQNRAILIPLLGMGSGLPVDSPIKVVVLVVPV